MVVDEPWIVGEIPQPQRLARSSPAVVIDEEAHPAVGAPDQRARIVALVATSITRLSWY